MAPVPSEIVQTLVSIGASVDADAEVRSSTTALEGYDWINRLHWSDWDTAVARLDIEQIAALFRGLVVVEWQLKWSGGSVAAAIWVFRALQRRDPGSANEAAAWAFGHHEESMGAFWCKESWCSRLE